MCDFGRIGYLADEYAVISYSQRLRDFFHDLFLISFETVSDLFETEDDFQSCIEALTDALTDFTPLRRAKLE
ncbi:hypothetical protein [Desulfonema magnum]|uniref:Uncharacterized protein n=1 Tax=Desulfonema magnum TaxID=45655 RepID=A0A975BIH3_9BACT|nr:hypothetical protein [Desulfonema magnum]QTA85734.1 Uncharacterized protein dnm_017480 [Desulfonema magnum]